MDKVHVLAPEGGRVEGYATVCPSVHVAVGYNHSAMETYSDCGGRDGVGRRLRAERHRIGQEATELFGSDHVTSTWRSHRGWSVISDYGDGDV
ncbi:hypothetical protein AXG93_2415s1190 [Marchantia polymorpha subsp. ruderalis]|uniref:Uncharacterized protein n=1 Tax=Marchantia polymorpha subsp. ruderalis TaxID=1480154 RepID=A0A176VUQ9_MARPO|nr:hypothetical protein AXG93_2415s1190 [Marchantia polymorpha subsp. ruderalis]